MSIAAFEDETQVASTDKPQTSAPNPIVTQATAQSVASGLSSHPCHGDIKVNLYLCLTL